MVPTIYFQGEHSLLCCQAEASLQKRRRKYQRLLEYVTHPFNNLPIPAIVYFINTLDSQTSERDKGKPTFLSCMLGTFFAKL